MKLRIAGQSYTFESSEKGTQELIEKVNRVLASENLFFSHLVIDGQEVYEEHEDFILKHVDKIKEVLVVTQTIKEFVNNLIVSLHDYTKRGIPEIEKLIDEFYQLPSENSWQTLTQLLDGIDWIYQSIKSIDRTEHKIENWDEFLKIAATFEVELPQLLQAIENKDSVLIADIIQYEILPQFQTIHDQTEQIFEVK